MKQKLFLLSMAIVMLCLQAAAQTQNIRGLTVILNYKDNTFNYSAAEVSQMMNQSGFNGFGGMIGSVKDFFYTQSNGKLTITSEVITVNMPNNLLDYYAGGSLGGYTFLADVCAQIKEQYPNGFTGLSVNPNNFNRLWNIHFLSNTAGGASYAFINTDQNAIIENDGVDVMIGRGNISVKNYYDNPPISTMTHEMGHSYFDWADYYGTAFCNLGDYDLMASAGTAKGPMPVNPALRLKEGWITDVVNISGTLTQKYTLTANSYSQIHKYTNPNNPSEYLLFHVLKHGGYYQPNEDGKPMDEGLAIWYVSEDGGFDLQGVWSSPFIRLVQADNMDEMHDEFIPNDADVRGDLNDLFDNTTSSFPNGTPFRWKDGGEFGISITGISAVGNTMEFTVNARPNTVLATSDRNGTISPKGVLSVTAGQSKTFSLIPNLGYEVDVVRVDGSPVTVSGNSYVLSGISGTRTFNVTFKKKAVIDPLPSPWVQTDIGTSPAGLSAHASGKFNIESFGTGIGGSADNFRYVFQTLNGDGSIVAKIDQTNNPNWSTKFGIMMRSSLEPGSAESMIGIMPFAQLFTLQRTATGAAIVDSKLPEYDGHFHKYVKHTWLKLTRTGDVIVASCSRDNITWIEMSRQTLSLGTSVYVGMFATGSFGTLASKAVFSNITVTSANASPTVSITSPLNDAVLSTNTVVINAVAADANGSVSKVDFYNGAVLIGTDNTAPYSFTWTNVPGTNVIYAKATDNLGAVTTSVPVTVSTPCNFTDPKLTGTVIGTPGSWNGYGNTREKAFDGDITTIFDAPESIAWTGLSLSQEYRMTGINFYPRAESAFRMVGGRFEGSSTADFSADVEILATIIAEPKYSWNCLSVSNTRTFKYFRYISPEGGVGNVAEIEFYGVPGNPAPTVSITSPLNNAAYAIPATITITANAADANGTVTVVGFYNGNTLLGADYTAPYSYVWSSVPAGNYSITARATDNNGAITTSSVVSITVASNPPPTVSITSPANNAVFSEPATITINANAADANGTVSSVAFYNGSTLLGTDASAPYSYIWSSVATGTYSITAKATDNQGAVTTSAAVSVTVNANIFPTVSITSPVNGATYAAPATITINANAADANGTVAVVGFYNGNTLLGADYSAPYSYTLSAATAGTYSINARATDNNGAISISDPITVIVEATTPGCTTEAIPNASQWVVRNSWNDQNSGSGVVTTTEALNVKHRQWGNADLSIIQTGKALAVVNGQTYTISFDFKNDALAPVTGIDVGLATGTSWNGATLAQPAVATTGALPASYTTKTVTITATSTGTVYVALKFKFNGQPSTAVNVFVKNISVCSAASSTAMRVSAAAAEPTKVEEGIVTGANPFSDQTTIKVAYTTTVPLTVVIKDANGITVWEAAGLQTNQVINIGSGLPIGTYIVQAYYAGTSNMVRLIKY